METAACVPAGFAFSLTRVIVQLGCRARWQEVLQGTARRAPAKGTLAGICKPSLPPLLRRVCGDSARAQVAAFLDIDAKKIGTVYADHR